MILNISDNNYKKLDEIVRSFQPEYVFLTEYSERVKEFLEYTAESNPSVREIYCLTPTKPNLEAIADSGTYQENVKPWPVSRYIKFLTGKNTVNFNDGHKPLFDGDWSRLSTARMHYLLGPFVRVTARIKAIKKHTIWEKIIGWALTPAGAVLQLIVPKFRRKYGEVSFFYKGIKVRIAFDGGPAKDHYGESPLMEEKYTALKQAVLDIPRKGTPKIGFFIVAGPRHEYINRVLDLEEQGKIRHFALFAASVYRPRGYKAMERRKDGAFSKGTNMTINNKPVYSDHCLSAGAGDKELWIYLRTNGSYVQKQQNH